LKFDGIMIYCVMGHCGAFWVYRRVYSSLWNMFPCLAQTLPSSKLNQSLSLSLSCHSGSMSREQSRNRWNRSKLGVFNEGPTGTASGKTPRPVESKTAAVLKCKQIHDPPKKKHLEAILFITSCICNTWSLQSKTRMLSIYIDTCTTVCVSVHERVC